MRDAIPRRRAPRTNNLNSLSALDNSHVYIKINNRKTQALIDTGCAHSCCSLSFARQLHASILPLEGGDPLYLFAATGQGVQTVGRVNLSLNFSGPLIPFTFLVLSELQPKILIGTNFLEYSKAKIDFEHNTIYLAENLVSLPFDKSSKEEAELFTIAAVTLPPLSETLIPLIIPRKFVGQTCLIEPIPTKQKINIGVARVVIHPHTQHTVCRVLNATHEPRVLRKRTCVAQVGLATVAATLPPSKISRGKVNLNAMQTPPALQVMEAAIQKTGIPVDRSILTDNEYYDLCCFLCKNLDVFATSVSDLGRTSLVYHQIDTGDAKPICQRAYRQP
ncbi:MAG TPA: retropepsin-like aspartic protease, partial [Methylomicrobium sp.]|nr:retropepsin-like aspartic protease [Methylomicrobium sp.]